MTRRDMLYDHVSSLCNSASVLAEEPSPCFQEYIYYNSQQQNALGYTPSMQGIGTVAIDGPRFEEFLRSRKESFEVSQGFCCWVAQPG